MKAIPLDSALQHRTQRATAQARPRAVLAGVAAALREWRRRARSRADLAGLDDRMLRDLGLSRADVCLEINKPFWRK